MTTEEQNEEVKRRPTPYTEKIQELPTRNPPIVYEPAPPKDVFHKYHDKVTKGVRKVWPKVQEDYVAEPFQSSFRYYDYGGQYSFICELPSGQPTYVTITESFEKEDGDLANNEAERRKRVCVSVS